MEYIPNSESHYHKSSHLKFLIPSAHKLTHRERALIKILPPQAAL